MRREEYLQQRRLQGLNSRIRRAEFQVLRGRARVLGMKESFVRTIAKHEVAVHKVESRVREKENQLETMKKEREVTAHGPIAVRREGCS